MASTKYEKQRGRVSVPHVPLSALRAAAGLTLDQVCERVNEHLQVTPKFARGSLSAIENGHRGASTKVLEALEVAYGLRPGDITTTYEPRSREVAVA